MDKIKRNRWAFKIGILVTFLLLLSGNLQVFAQCGVSWGISHYNRPDLNWAVANNGTRFVSVGYDVVLYTDDGVHWTYGTPPRHTNQWGLVYAEGKFVAVGTKNHISTSTNGASWIERRFLAAGTLWAVTHGEGTFVTVGDDGQVLTSPDGITWTVRNNGISERLQAVTYGNGLFIAAGSSGGIYSSDDVGVSWTKRANASDGIMSAAFGNNIYVLGGRAGLVYTSSNGIDWVKRNPGVSVLFRGLTYSSSIGFIAVGSRSSSGYCMIMTSPNGTSWTWRNNPVTSTLLGVSTNNNIVVTVGMSFIATSMCSPPAGGLLDMASPNGGEEWSKGATPYIRWGSFGSVGNVKLDYSVNNGDTWTNIVASTANDGKHPWTVPNESSTQCLVRVSEASDGTPVDTSDATFTIGGVVVNTINITSPTTGVTWQANTTKNITWKGSVKFNKIDIEYYNGTTWNVIVTGTADDGVHPWKVPDISTSNAKIWIKGYDGLTNPTNYSGTFTISGGPPPVQNTITITTPNGGEMLTGEENYSIRWKGSISFSKVDIEYYDGSRWNGIVKGTADDGIYGWSVPNISTTDAKIWIKGYDGGINPTDYSDEAFIISPKPTGSLTLTTPNGGEVWVKGSTQNITWTSSGEVGNVKISYSTDNGVNWTTIVSSTSNDESYAWNLPNIISDDCLVKIADVSYSQISDLSDNIFSIGGPPVIVLSKARFNFGGISNGASPCGQTLFISNSGGGTLNWTAQADASWLNLNPGSGTGGGVVTISIDPTGLNPQTYMGTITVSDPEVENSPQTAEVYLTVKSALQDDSPFGLLATPLDGSTGVSGSIAVTGWALDDTCVESVKIYRQVDNYLSYIGDAVFVEGARPDVEQAYPDYPNSYRAGWGYMLLTNFLPDGQLILKAIATDTTGQQTELGTTTIVVDNANAVKPFGAIDTPEQGGDVSGTKYRNNGWALTPQPNKIPESGATIQVFIDGVPMGNVGYNLYRSDIADFFSGYANSDGSWGYFDFDTTAYENGVHTISWSVTDNAGNTDGIGSRYFNILNTGGASESSARMTAAAAFKTDLPAKDIPLDYIEPIAVRKGYNRDVDTRVIYPGEGGTIRLQTRELLPIAIHLPGVYTGYLEVGSQLKPLPIGSRLDIKKGIFYWLPGPGFLGEYKLRFILKDSEGTSKKKDIRLKILPGIKKGEN